MSEWISIFKNKPELGQGVLIHLNNHVITVGYRKIEDETGYWCIFGDNDMTGITDTNYVTHWMPLPELP